MDLGLTDKVVVVAASSAGLGKACAMQFAEEGAQVVVSGRDEARLQQASADIQAVTDKKVLAVPADMTVVADIDALIDKVVAEFGSIHVLVNNAGGPPPGNFEDMSDEDWQAAFELSLMSTVRMTRASLPYMRKQKWGRVANITSMTVKQPVNELLLSNSLRLGVVGWAKTVSNQLAAENILINNLCPGWTRTDRVTGLLNNRAESAGSSVAAEEQKIVDLIPMGRLGTPQEFANMLVFICSERCSYITGTAIQVDGGMTAGFS